MHIDLSNIYFLDSLHLIEINLFTFWKPKLITLSNYKDHNKALWHDQVKLYSFSCLPKIIQINWHWRNYHLPQGAKYPNNLIEPLRKRAFRKFNHSSLLFFTLSPFKMCFTTLNLRVNIITRLPPAVTMLVISRWLQKLISQSFEQKKTSTITLHY